MLCGTHHSEETKKKISESKKGAKLSEDTKKKIGEGNRGKVLSEETKRKMSKAAEGRHASIEARKKMSIAHKGRKISEEIRKRMGKGNKGKKFSEEWKAKISKAHQGKILSESHKEKLSEAHKGKKLSKEHKEKISKSNKGAKRSKKLRERISKTLTQTYLEGKRKRVYNFSRGEYFSSKNDKFFYYRSSYELLAYQILERMKKVVRYEAEPLAISYLDTNGQERHYIPDIWVLYDDRTEELIEVKARSFINSPESKQKRKAAKKYCIEKDWNFSVWTKTRNSRLQKMVRIEVLN